jgi:hypothetical protein
MSRPPPTAQELARTRAAFDAVWRYLLADTKPAPKPAQEVLPIAS